MALIRQGLNEWPRRPKGKETLGIMPQGNLPRQPCVARLLCCTSGLPRTSSTSPKTVPKTGSPAFETRRQAGQTAPVHCNEITTATIGEKALPSRTNTQQEAATLVCAGRDRRAARYVTTPGANARHIAGDLRWQPATTQH